MRLHEWVSLVVRLDQCRGVYLVGWFPGVVCVWIPLPFEEILQGLCLSIEAVINNGLDFVLVFTLDQLGGWFDVIGAVLRSFAVGCEEAGVEHVVDLPGIG
jgi:hypothetical protein